MLDARTSTAKRFSSTLRSAARAAPSLAIAGLVRCISLGGRTLTHRRGRWCRRFRNMLPPSASGHPCFPRPTSLQPVRAVPRVVILVRHLNLDTPMLAHARPERCAIRHDYLERAAVAPYQSHVLAAGPLAGGYRNNGTVRLGCRAELNQSFQRAAKPSAAGFVAHLGDPDTVGRLRRRRRPDQFTRLATTG